MRNNYSKTKAKSLEEEPKVLQDVNLTIRNQLKDSNDDGDNSDLAHNSSFRFLWQRQSRFCTATFASSSKPLKVVAVKGGDGSESKGILDEF